MKLLYNLKLHSSKTTKIPLSQQNLLCIFTPPFCDELPKGNHSSSKGGGGSDRLKLAKSALKA